MKNFHGWFHYFKREKVIFIVHTLSSIKTFDIPHTDSSSLLCIKLSIPLYSSRRNGTNMTERKLGSGLLLAFYHDGKRGRFDRASGGRWALPFPLRLCMYFQMSAQVTKERETSITSKTSQQFSPERKKKVFVHAWNLQLTGMRLFTGMAIDMRFQGTGFEKLFGTSGTLVDLSLFQGQIGLSTLGHGWMRKTVKSGSEERGRKSWQRKKGRLVLIAWLFSLFSEKWPKKSTMAFFFYVSMCTLTLGPAFYRMEISLGIQAESSKMFRSPFKRENHPWLANDFLLGMYIKSRSDVTCVNIMSLIISCKPFQIGKIDRRSSGIACWLMVIRTLHCH